jgi:hypothetical protein
MLGSKKRLPAKLRLGDRFASSRRRRLLLPGALLVAIGAELFAPLMFVNFTFPSFLQ